MERIGLIPSNTGKPGGKKTGLKVTHYIEPNGLFDKVCAEYLKTGAKISYADLNPMSEKLWVKPAKKFKYVCERDEVTAWAEFGTELKCGKCNENLTICLTRKKQKKKVDA